MLDLLAQLTADSVDASSLDTRTLVLVRLAALVAVDAPPASHLTNLEAAAEVGVDAEEQDEAWHSPRARGPTDARAAGKEQGVPHEPDDPDDDRDDAGPAAGTAPLQSLTARRRRALVTLGLLRAGATAVLLVALYYLLPLDRRSTESLVLVLAVSLTALLATTVWQVRAIIRSDYPGIRATQALATVVPLFLLVFATTYFMLSFQEPASFSERLNRSDALYFTITTFATVGLGDISPVAEGVRLLVAGQVLLDLVVLGLGIKVVIGAVKKGRAG